MLEEDYVINRLRARNKRLRKYTQHKPNCKINFVNNVIGVANKCTCGLDKLLKED